ncbi:Urb1p [Sporobolomyces koalae]|uniref:Urb1p n=1 Tax=Sporobolomyces koalae TaxID=500713 RepID=UPI00316B7419
MAEPVSGGVGTKFQVSKLPTIDPFTSAESIVQSLQIQDALLLQASLVQIDRRASALNAKPAPRGSPDLLLDYLKQYPACDGIFHAWDFANKTNSSPLSTAILSCLTSLIRLLSTDPFTPSPELIKTLLSSKYTPYLERALNPGRNDVTTSALRLANVLVGFAGGRFAKKLFGAFGWSPKITTRLYKTRLRSTTSANVLQKPDIRTLLVLLVLSFLSAGDVKLKSLVLETKGLLSGVIKGLNEDPAVVVNLVLEVVFREIVGDRRVGLEARRNVFDESCINELMKLYDYPLPEISEESPLAATHPTLSVHRFFYALTNWLADQIASSPIGRSSGPQKILSTLLKSLQVTEDESHRTLALYILEKSPILSGQFWSKFPSSLDPRLSSKWISAITFATQVVALPIPTTLSLPEDRHADSANTVTSAPPSVQSILDTILPPSPPSSQTLSRTWYTKSLTHPNPLVSFLSSIFLLSILQKASKVLEAMMQVSQTLEEGPQGRWVESMRRIREEIKNRVPDVGIVVGLMSRTAAAAAAAAPSGVAKGTSEEEVGKKAGSADESAALLRTNIALRLLYLYHRVVPSLIATLKFDFTKLPQTFNVIKPVDHHDAESEESQGERGGEGLRAISSSYALRLAAVHETGAASFNRPGDHFKSLLPLFSLYRVSSLTPSNRSLLLQTLKRQLSTPLLFGQNEDVEDVDTWLQSLPTPLSDSDVDAKEVMDWFEKTVQKTLTSPIKPKTNNDSENLDEEEPKLSPLMRNALISLATLESPSESIQVFVRDLFVNYLSRSSSVHKAEYLFEQIKEAWKARKEMVKPLLKDLADMLELVKGQVKEKKLEAGEAKAKIENADEDELAVVLKSLNPRRENLFLALEGSEELLRTIVPQAPLALVFLHARPSDLVQVTSLLSQSSATSLVPAAQILLHRFIHSSTVEHRRAFATGLVQLYALAHDQDKAEIRGRIAGRDGVLGAFEAEKESEETVEVFANLIGDIFSPARVSDVELVRPFASVLDKDLASSPAVLSQRIIGSARLLPFFDEQAILPFVSTLLSQMAPGAIDAKFANLLASTFYRLATVPSSPEFDQLWTQYFKMIVKASSSSSLELARAADQILLKGTSSIVAASASKPLIARTHTALPFSEWTSALLDGSSDLSVAQATTLSAILSRSTPAREQFLAYLENRPFTEAFEAPLKTVLEVAIARNDPVKLDAQTSKLVVDSVLSREQVGDNSLGLIENLVKISPVAGTIIRSTLEESLASTSRDGYKASTVALVGRLAEQDEGLKIVLEGYVNGMFDGLTRKFVDAKQDEEVETALAVALGKFFLSRVLNKQEIALKGHLVEPLVTAIATNRLGHAETADLAAAICKRHHFKDNEVTRHLNEIFASQAFLDFVSSATTPDATCLSTIKLALALAAQSPLAAGSARAIDRLLPFYRGTVSPFDRSLLNLFVLIERSGTSSATVAFKSWNPSTDSSTLLDGTRVGALGALRKAFIRRSWARAFASTRISYTTEEDETTYDPRFIVAFVLALVEEDDLKPQEWTTFLESGALGTVVAALASTDDGLRRMARATCALMYKKVELLTFRERDEVVLLLAHCRNATYSPVGEAIPSTIALFLAHCAAQLGTPASPLYPAFTRFLLQRSTLDMRDVPMFYTMLYSSKADEWAAAPREERGWMVRYLTEGLVRSQDWKIYRRRQVFELLASLFHSSRQDAPLRKLILEFIARATMIPTAARELLSRNGLIGWIAAQTCLDSTERRLFVSILTNLAQIMTFDKVAGVADLLDALTVVIGTDLFSINAATLLSLLYSIVSRLPSSVGAQASPVLALTLDRITSLLDSIKSHLATPAHRDVARLFYVTTVALAFVKHEARVEETAQDGANWKAAIALGLEAGVTELEKEILRLQQ